MKSNKLNFDFLPFISWGLIGQSDVEWIPNHGNKLMDLDIVSSFNEFNWFLFIAVRKGCR